MKTANPQTVLERKIHRCFGDTMGNGENYCTWCNLCHGYHEEHVKVLMAVTNWPCTRAQKYHREVVNRCLETTVRDRRMFDVVYRRFVRLAPYCRWPEETDPQYLTRMVKLHQAKRQWDDILMKDGKSDLKRFEGLRLRPDLQAKADEIKKRHPIRTRKSAPGRKREMEP